MTIIIITRTRTMLGLTLVVFLILFVSIPIKVYGLETLTPEQQLITKSYHRLFEVTREMETKGTLTHEQTEKIITYISTPEFRHEFITLYRETKGFTTNEELMRQYMGKWWLEMVLTVTFPLPPLTSLLSPQIGESELTMFGGVTSK